MTVLLHGSGDLPDGGWERWVEVRASKSVRLDETLRLDGTERALESAFAETQPQWWALAAQLAVEPSARLCHAATAGGNVSDLGAMLAWTRLVAAWAETAPTILCICDDPWLFRHLRGIPGVRAGKAPPLWRSEIRLTMRGWLSRMAVAGRMVRASLACRGQTHSVSHGDPAILVYGHPASRTDGFDAYFGALSTYRCDIKRILHVDCPPSRAQELGVGLHGWGSPWAALTLAFRRWRPRIEGPCAWLIRRAAALEGATGTPAMIAWQIHCQRRFLKKAHPSVVAWPWENHAWERDFARTCRQAGVTTLGYQHATIGTLEGNYAAYSLPDDTQALPDTIGCAGSLSMARLADWGVPPDRLWLAGAWRFPAPDRVPTWSPDAPVFLVLPALPKVAAQMLDAARRAARSGIRFLVREHPMTPVGFVPEPGLERSPGGLYDLDRVKGVVFAASTVGLEAMLAGLPVVRFLARDEAVNDILPPGLDVSAATADELPDRIRRIAGPAVSALDAGSVFAHIDPARWCERFGGKR